MKYIITTLVTILAIGMFTTSKAQVATPFIKCEFDGKASSYNANVLLTYNTYKPVEEDALEHNRHVFTVAYDPKSNYTIDISIFTAPHMVPVVGTLPFADKFGTKEMTLPSVNIEVSRKIGGNYEFFETTTKLEGKFEITKIAGGWVEGKFEITIPNKFDEQSPSLKITNGTFKFKIEKESKD